MFFFVIGGDDELLAKRPIRVHYKDNIDDDKTDVAAIDESSSSKPKREKVSKTVEIHPSAVIALLSFLERDGISNEPRTNFIPFMGDKSLLLTTIQKGVQIGKFYELPKKNVFDGPFRGSIRLLCSAFTK